ncbi:MAG: RdgB/HAM1 family non-canonical purine NTP pyrophosphatase [Spirochaetaceae bacterium]|jgi:XTP/dITP diphosphohydrolase|nr:RdgB/HAM1 family non-canonical purine NTP pyrophosphatase [Spirochaetaceae bacterium]
MNLWFATGNPHKREELAAILQGHRIQIPSQGGLPFGPEETGATFLENALIKARTLYRLVLAPVIADDSGLCVDALGGRPGIFSARYGSEGGKNLDAGERNALLLRELESSSRRSARFICAMVLLLHEDRFFAVQETLEGEIIREGRGSGGFGYDPILYLPGRGCTVAELREEEKNRISHRGKAGRVIGEILAAIPDGL